MKSTLFQAFLITCLLFGLCYNCTDPDRTVKVVDGKANVRDAAEDGDIVGESPSKVTILCWTTGDYVAYYGSHEWLQVCYKEFGEFVTGYMHDGVLDCGGVCRKQDDLDIDEC